MDFSIVISTYNRADVLDRTLSTICGLTVDSGATWELIVVDNGSTDSTREVCGRYARALPLRYLREMRQGQNYAANYGVSEARSDLILLTDDDVDVTPGWASAILDAARQNESASFFGGKVLSRWQGVPPRWFSENVDMIRSNPRVDLGSAQRRFSNGDEPRLIGANLAFRKTLFESGFRFREELGPSGDGRSGGRVGPAELDWEERVLQAGHEGMYVPDALVYHRDPPWRMTEKYVRHWYVESGRNRVKQGEVPGGHEWFGAPRYLWRECLTHALIYLATRWCGPSRRWLSAECRMALAWGSIRECRAQRTTGNRETAPDSTRRSTSLGARIQWRKAQALGWINGLLVRMGPKAFIGFHWPWPLRKPWMRDRITIQPLGGGLGDELMCLPILAEIKRRNPACKIRFVTRRPEFFRGQPGVDDVTAPEPGRRACMLVYNYVIPPPRPLITLMAECAGIEGRFPRIPPLKITPSDFIKGHVDGLARPLVVVQPQASGWTTNKNWPAPYWQELVRSLTAEAQVIEVGNASVLPAGEMGARFTSVCGSTSIDDLAYAISQADLFIGPISSGMHLANAFEVPALILFGGYEEPAGHDYPNVHPIYSAVECAPCWRQTCPYALKCLHAIQPQSVFAEAMKLLHRIPAPRPSALSPSR
jgi:ADP-heptose:LPS heptosyltransferase/glycosyltransferase involved in cell wall biosynthesis